jgi:hypothetical protein
MVDDSARHLLLFGFTWPLRVLLAPASSKRTFLLCYCLLFFFTFSLFRKFSKVSMLSGLKVWRKRLMTLLSDLCILVRNQFSNGGFRCNSRYSQSPNMSTRSKWGLMKLLFQILARKDAFDDLGLSLDCELGFVKASQLFAMTTIYFPSKIPFAVHKSHPPTETIVHPPPSILRWDVKQNDTQPQP